MAKKNEDLLLALGVPEGEDVEVEVEEEEAGSYLSSKPAELQAYLRDATDPTLTADERAEALCRALDYTPEAPEVDEAPVVDEYLDEE
jgi:hypothetical protein